MLIPWKLKSKIFAFIDFFRLSHLLYFIQKYITGHSSRKSVRFNPLWELHKNSLIKYKTLNTVFEFGAGKSLVQNLYFTEIINKQILFDIKDMIDLDLVNLSQKFLIQEKKNKIQINN